MESKADSITLHPWRGNSVSPEVKHYHIYFITGNPGVISLYAPFFSRLEFLLNKSGHTRYHIYGSSLPGFELQSADREAKLPASLEQQIIHTEILINKMISSQFKDDKKAPKVILMGHSIGCYILLEIFRRRNENISHLKNIDLRGGILLFPTITHIGQSRNGKIASSLFQIPYFVDIAPTLVKILFCLVPVKLLCLLIQIFAWMPPVGALACAKFIRSPLGVYQALYMAKDEMETVNEDRWGADIWGSRHSDNKTAVLPLIMYFGEQVCCANSECL